MLNIRENIALSQHTIYRIGGPARFFIEVKTAEELTEALVFAKDKKAPFFILGAGSNILVSENGFAGLVIHLKDGSVSIDGERMFVDAGVMMARAVFASVKAGLTGFEWGVGVPGTIGGSIRGNAGCFGGEVDQILETVRALEVKSEKLKVKSTTEFLKLFELNNTECEFEYRDSIFKRHPEWTILSATFKLKKGDPRKIQEKVRSIIFERTAKQDIGTKTCGCIFKNISWEKAGLNKEKLLERFPEFREFQNRPNLPASFLIDRAGLSGKRIGKVFISPKHANFFVNEGGASSEEVRQLIQLAKNEIEKKYGLPIEEEIVYVGF